MTESDIARGTRVPLEELTTPKPNILRGASVCIIELKAKPELNGCTGIVCGPCDEKTGRWPVELDLTHRHLCSTPVIALCFINLQLLETSDSVSIGTRVRVVGVIQKPELNDRTGIVFSQNLKSGRLQICVDSSEQEFYSLKFSNLVVLVRQVSDELVQCLVEDNRFDSENYFPRKLYCNLLLLRLHTNIYFF